MSVASERWSTASVALHWLGALLLVGLAAAGFVMTGLGAGSSERLWLARAHTLGGAALMLLTVARLVVRRRGPKVAPLELGALHRRGVGAVHALLYAVIFALGLSGAVTGATSAWPDYLRGAVATAPELATRWPRQAHEALVLALVGLVALHVGGVLVQHLRRGGVLQRMAPLAR
jgi:cytochrome b561